MMTPEELDEARAKEAYREAAKLHRRGTPAVIDVAIRAARLGREAADARIKNLEAKVAELEGALPLPQHGVDPDILAFREWAAKEWPIASEAASAGHMDTTRYAQAYLAGARMAREQERERAKALVDQAKAIIDQHARLLARLPLGLRAEIGIEWQTMMDATASFYAKYRGEA